MIRAVINLQLWGMVVMSLLSESEKKYLLNLAREAIKYHLQGKELPLERPPTPSLLEKRGVFVTLIENGRLRGCIGTLEPISSIVSAVRENAVAAAFSDPRFYPLTEKELENVKIEISILSPLERIHSSSPEQLLSFLKPGVHGLYICKGPASATFLPQVWEELPNPSDFVSQLCVKAGLFANEWKNPGMEFYVYTVEKFSE